VQFVLRTSRNLWRKEILIVDQRSSSSGQWTIFTDGARRNDQNSLYTSQLDGSYLIFRKAKGWGQMKEVARVYISAVKPGQQLTFTWNRD